VLVRLKPRAGEKRTNWLLIKHRDEWSGEVDITTFAPRSITSGGDCADVLAADKPTVWESHRPARGGAAGAMLRQVIDEAKRIKESRSSESRDRRPAGKKARAAKPGAKRKVAQRRSPAKS
jgi:bifunctional non-homologous end joining protein LigD